MSLRIDIDVLARIKHRVPAHLLSEWTAAEPKDPQGFLEQARTAIRGRRQNGKRFMVAWHPHFAHGVLRCHSQTYLDDRWQERRWTFFRARTPQLVDVADCVESLYEELVSGCLSLEMMRDRAFRSRVVFETSTLRLCLQVGEPNDVAGDCVLGWRDAPIGIDVTNSIEWDVLYRVCGRYGSGLPPLARPTDPAALREWLVLSDERALLEDQMTAWRRARSCRNGRHSPEHAAAWFKVFLRADGSVDPERISGARFRELSDQADILTERMRLLGRETDTAP